MERGARYLIGYYQRSAAFYYSEVRIAREQIGNDAFAVYVQNRAAQFSAAERSMRGVEE